MFTTQQYVNLGETNDDIVMSPPLNFDNTQESEFQSMADPDESGGPKKSDIFKKYFKKIKDPNNICKILAVCNYYSKQYSFSGGYRSLWKHITNKHASEVGIDRIKSQITGYAGSAPLFHYSNTNNRELIGHNPK